MAHEILSIKLSELEEQIARLISRIQLSETADRAQLRREIGSLKQEYLENELILQKKLQLSRAEASPPSPAPMRRSSRPSGMAGTLCRHRCPATTA